MSRKKVMIRKMCIPLLLAMGTAAPTMAQEAPFVKPSWWFGGAAGANFNFYNGSTNQLTDNFTPPVAFHNGKGVGLFLAPLVEFHRPGSRWGGMLQVGYDSRKGTFDQQMTPCDCPADLTTNLGYVTVEPSLRFAPFKSGFYLMGGPRVAFNVRNEFTYKQGINPAYPDQIAEPDVTGELSQVHKTLLSMQIGAGYDIPLSSPVKQNQMVLSPFVSFQPYFGQSPRAVDTWTVTTLRVGAALKFGRGRVNPAAVLKDPPVSFGVNSPSNVPEQSQMRETFPLRNYVFFPLGSTEIPERYKLLRKDQVKDFQVNQVKQSSPTHSARRSDREMAVYYNVLNILGDRMVQNPSATILLVGSSESGPADAQAMASSVKRYLVDVFGIAGSRISVEGRNKPKIPSGTAGGTQELDLLREGDRRVSIESTSPEMLMAFHSGSDTHLKPVEIQAMQVAPPESYVAFDAAGANEAFSTWSLEVKDEKGVVQHFGPYTEDRVSIPGSVILGTRPEGNYTITMVGQTKTGKTVTEQTTAKLVLWTPPKDEEGMRFSVLYEFNETKAIALYEKYLTETVAPKIPRNGKVIIRGYTDVIGDEANNQQLSEARANDVKRILEQALTNTGRKDVTFEVTGFGEDQNQAPFENKLPEGRAYNRTVIIDITPGK